MRLKSSGRAIERILGITECHLHINCEGIFLLPLISKLKATWHMTPHSIPGSDVCRYDSNNRRSRPVRFRAITQPSVFEVVDECASTALLLRMALSP